MFASLEEGWREDGGVAEVGDGIFCGSRPEGCAMMAVLRQKEQEEVVVVPEKEQTAVWS